MKIYAEPTQETVLKGRSGITIVIHRYGVNDFSAWFTDDPSDDTSGSSVRGSLDAIIFELSDEMPLEEILI